VARALAEFRKRGLIRQRGRSISHIDPQIALLATRHPTTADVALPSGSLH